MADVVNASTVAEVAVRTGSEREAAWIVEHVAATGGDSTTVRARALALAGRVAAGEPLQYVLGTWAFRTLELVVDRRVLIPRPETEQVAEVALTELDRVAAAPGEGLLAVDLGTGSGAVALSLAAEGRTRDRPFVVWATDVSSDALAVTRVNLDRLAATDAPAASRVRLAHGSWFTALPATEAGRLDLVVANPPYVSEEEFAVLPAVVREHEPRGALVSARGAGGVPGAADLEAVIAGAARWLRRGGALVVELAPAQAYAAIDAARRAGFARVGTAHDLAGRMRMLVAER